MAYKFISLLFLTLFINIPQAQAQEKSSKRDWENNYSIERAIKAGTKFLASSQLADGSWKYQTGSTKGWHDGQGTYQMTLTSVSAMALLSTGNTTERGKYSHHVKKAVNFILRVAKSSSFRKQGLLTTPNEGLTMYGHGYATLFLAQIYGTSSNAKLNKDIRLTIRKAIQLIAKSQSKDGGWYYEPNSNDDEGSVTITQVQALRAAQNVGITVNKKIIDRALKYLNMCQNRDGGIRYDKRPNQPSSPALTAAGLACYYNCGIYDGKNVRLLHKFLKTKFGYSKTNPKMKLTFNLHIMGTGHDMYTHHYASQAIFFVGGHFWESYFKAISKKLVREQARDGSWLAIPNKAFATSMSLMILTLPYRYLPINQR